MENFIYREPITPQTGVIANSKLTVPPNCFGVLMQNGRAIFTFESGSHTVYPEKFPQIGRMRRERDGHDVLDVECFLVRSIPTAIPCDTVVPASNPAGRGLAFVPIKSQITVRIDNPEYFLEAVHRQVYESAKANSTPKSFQLSMPDREAKGFSAEHFYKYGNEICSLYASACVEKIAVSLQLPPDQLGNQRKELQDTATPEIIRKLREIGVALEEFHIAAIGEVQGVPCDVCGSNTSPTSNATFRYNVSAIVYLYTKQMKKVYCFSCAIKRGLAYTGICIVGGWWGPLGLVVTPVFVLMNLYNLVRLGFFVFPARRVLAPASQHR